MNNKMISNTAILNDMLKQSKYGLAPQDGAAFMNAHNEEDKVDILKKVFNRDISNFETIKLWQDKEVPEYCKSYKLQNLPQVAFFPAEGEGERGMVLVAPGGGYNCKVSQVEGYPIIQQLVQSGFSAGLLDYRVKPYSQHVSFMDIKRAIKVLRYKSEELNIKKDRIAVMGGSAGGHLSCMAAVHYDLENPKEKDPVERESSRPDAALIMYGLFSLVAFPETVRFIKTGKDRPDLLQATGLVSPYSDSIRKDNFFFSPEKHVTPDTPPFFMWQTCDNDDPRNMFNFAKELADSGVRFEAHIFPHGGHGMGLADGANPLTPKDEHVMGWFGLAAEWLKLNGF